MRTISVGGERQRVPETEREHAGQAVASASKALRMALAFRHLNPDAMTAEEAHWVTRLVDQTEVLARDLGYEVRS